MKINYFSVKELAQNFLLLFSLLLSATLVGSEKAIAQSTTINFGGKVDASCMLGTPTDGVVGIKDAITVAGRSSLITTTPGKVSVSCNGSSVNVTISSFTNTSDGGNTDSGTATVKDQSGNQMNTASLGGSSLGSGTAYAGAFENQLFSVEISLFNSASAQIQAGTYRYTVGLTFTAAP